MRAVFEDVVVVAGCRPGLSEEFGSVLLSMVFPFELQRSFSPSQPRKLVFDQSCQIREPGRACGWSCCGKGKEGRG